MKLILVFLLAIAKLASAIVNPLVGVRPTLDEAMESADCASQDRHDCDGDGSPFGDDRDDRNPKVQ
jgi:hypothetical protein